MLCVAGLISPQSAFANDYSSQDVKMIAADFDGDGKADLLVQSIAYDGTVQIVLTDGNGQPSILKQSWSRGYLGIAWDVSEDNIYAADFNGDGRADLLVQSRSQDMAYLLLQNASGTFTTVNATFTSNTYGYSWYEDDHHLVIGDFNGDGKADVFMQPAHIGNKAAEFVSTGTGFTLIKSWLGATHLLGFAWTSDDALIYAGDFNGDGRDDLLVVPRPNISMLFLPLDAPIGRSSGDPYGIVLADAGSSPAGQLDAVGQTWNQIGTGGADWSPETHNVIVGDFDGDGKADVLLQSISAGGSTWLVTKSSTKLLGTIVGTWQDGNSGINWSAGNTTIVAGYFNGPLADPATGRQISTSGLYLQSTSFDTPNAIATFYNDAVYMVADHTLDTLVPPDDGSAEPVPTQGEPGSIPGEFSVDVSGGANYQMTLQLPPGINGLQPDMHLAYSSHSGNGFMGIGWSLGGLSAISRCPRTLAQDGVVGGVTMAATDRFCIDGRRLMSVGGSTYRTEMDTFQKVTSHGTAGSGPDWFDSLDASHQHRYFGDTDDTSVTASDGSKISWPMSKVMDESNNTITYHYDNSDPGEPLISEIDYGNNAGTTVGSVIFTYEARPDARSGYIGKYGTSARQQNSTQRLVKISTYEYGNLVMTYGFTYQQGRSTNRSQLTSVQQCGADGLCLKPTKFTWSQGIAGFNSSSINTRFPAGVNNLQFGDLDGDGIPDYLYTDTSSSDDGHWHIRFGDNPNAPTTTSVYLNTDAPHALMADFNGDGKSDLLVPTSGGNPVNNYWELYTSTGVGLGSPAMMTMLNPDCQGLTGSAHQTCIVNEGSTLAWPVAGASKSPALVSLDGNGHLDLIYRNANSSGKQVIWIIYYDPSLAAYTQIQTNIQVSDTQRFLPINFTGGGKPDIYITSQGCTNVDPCWANSGVFTWNGQTLAPVTSGDIKADYPVFIDANGDGLTDILRVVMTATNNYEWELDINHGANWRYSWSGFSAANHEENYTQPLDYDRDGLDDAIIPHGNTWWVLRSDGTNMNPINTHFDASTTFNNGRVMDIDSDGFEDLMFVSGSYWYDYAGNSDEMPDLVTQVQNGQGAQTVIGYAALDDVYAAVYGSDSNLPPIDLDTMQPSLGPNYVVKQFGASDGTLSTISDQGMVYTSYAYWGSRTSTVGRGSLGFAVVQAYNSNTGIITETYSSQTWPYIGMVTKSVEALKATQPKLVGRAGLAANFANKCVVDPANDDMDCPTNPPVPPALLSPSSYTRKTTSSLDNLVPALDASGATTGVTVFPFVKTSDELLYSLDTHQLYKEVATLNNYTPWGEIQDVKVTTDNGNGGDTHVIETVSHYDSDSISNWCLSMLSEVDTNLSGADGAGALKHLYTYTTDGSCLLKTDVSNAQDPAVQVTKTYQYDAFGNRSDVLIEGQGFTSRETKTTYDNDGLYPVSTQTPLALMLGKYATTSWDKRFGQKATDTGIDGLINTTLYDSLGRSIEQDSARPGVKVTFDYDWCSAQCHTPVSVMVTTRTDHIGSDTSVSTTELDVLGRAVYASQQGLNGSTIGQYTAYDPLARPYLSSNPTFIHNGVPSSPVCWTYRTYDALSRPTAVYSPAQQADCSNSWTLGTSGTAYIGFRDPTTDPSVFATGNFITMTTTYTDRQTGIVVTQHVGSDGSTVGTGLTPTSSTIQRLSVMGKVISATDAKNQTTTYGYDAYGNNARVTDPYSNSVVRTYDTAGHLKRLSDPDMGSWVYTVDALGDVITQTDANGVVLTSSYDAAGRRMSQSGQPAPVDTGNQPFPQAWTGTTTWTYDTAPGNGIGRVASVTGPDYAVVAGVASGSLKTYKYDSYGAPISVTTSVDGKDYVVDTTYNSGGLPDVITYPDASFSQTPLRLAVRYGYDGHGHLLSLTDTASGTVYWKATLDTPTGQISGEQLGNGVVSARLYDAATGRILGISSGPGQDGSLQDLQYGWDSVGNLIERDDELAQMHECFSYDSLYRLKGTATVPGSDPNLGGCGTNPIVAYGYDDIGDLKTKGALNLTYYPSGDGLPTPHAVQNTDTDQFTYDADGNLTSRCPIGTTPPCAGGEAVTWYASNKPYQITKGAYSSTFWYDGLQNIYKETDVTSSGTLQVLHVDDVFEQERNLTTGVTRDRMYVSVNGVNVAIYAHATNASDRVDYPLHDNLGSVDVLTDSSAVPSQKTSYDAWGWSRDPASWTASATFAGTFPYQEGEGYTGHENLDDLGLVHMGGRVYDPALGRFMSPDPNVQFPVGTQGFNRYSYVGNNPASLRDPSGYFEVVSGSSVLEQILDPNLAFAAHPLDPAHDAKMFLFREMNHDQFTIVNTIGSAFCLTWYAACYAGGTYDYDRAHGASGKRALMDAAIAYISNSGTAGDSPTWTGILKNAAENSVKGYMDQVIRDEMHRFANRNGMSLLQMDAYLEVLSFAGEAWADHEGVGGEGGSRLRKVEIDGHTEVDIAGYGSQGVSIPGIGTNVVDTLLEYQGVPSSTGIYYMMHYRGVPIHAAHSLGALTANNLVFMGQAPSANLYALPFGAAAAAHTTVMISSRDIIAGGIFGSILNPEAVAAPFSPYFGGHGGQEIYKLNTTFWSHP